MTRFCFFASILAACLHWSTADAAAPAEVPAPVSVQMNAQPDPADVLPLRSFSIGPRWSGSWQQRGPLVLQVRLLLDAAPDDWLQVSVRVPDGYRSGEWGPGEWIAFYFLAHSPAATFEISLRPTTAAESTVSFPLLVQAGGRRTWLSVYLNGTANGYAAALVEIDRDGNPRWFANPDARADPHPRQTSYWSLTASVSDALAFIADVLQIDLYARHYLSRWCGVGMRPTSPQAALSEVAACAGCEVQQLGKREYAVAFADGYRGPPDTSWFVVPQGEELRVYANDAPAAEVIPALVESAGATMSASPDLDLSSVTCDHTGSLRGSLEAVCARARPPLVWAEHDGVFSFTTRRKE